MRRALAILFAISCGCGQEPPAEVRAPVEVPEIEMPLVEWAGCAELEGGACQLGEARTLSIWVDVHGAAEIDVRIDDAVVEVERRVADNGVGMKVEVPIGSRSVSVSGVDPRWSESWEMAIAELEEPAVIEEVEALAKAGKIEAAIAMAGQALEGAHGRERVRLLDSQRRILYTAGDLQGALRTASEIAVLANRIGLPVTETTASAAAAFISGALGDQTSARRHIARLRELGETLPEARFKASYQNSVLARNAGDTMLALRELTEAERLADRLGHSQLAEVSPLLASVLGDLGRGAEARAALDRSIQYAAKVGCADLGRMLNTSGYTLLVLAEQGLDDEPATPFLEEAQSLVAPDGECPTPDLHADVMVDLALDALENGEPDEALDHLAAIDELPPGLAPWVDEIEAQIGLDTGRWELLPALVERPDPSLPLALRWAAHVRQGRLLERLGLVDAAVHAQLEAEALLEEGTNGIGVDASSELFLAGRAASSRELVRMLVDAGRNDEALCRARLARGRALRRLDRAARLSRAPAEVRQRWSDSVIAFANARTRLVGEAARDWELSGPERERAQARRQSEQDDATRGLADAFEAMGARLEPPQCDDLVPVPPDEQLVLTFPLDDGWIVFFATSTHVEAIPIAEPDASGNGFLDALASKITASRLRLLPTGRSWRLPFHALARGDHMLLDDAIVTYSLDLDATVDDDEANRAVIVSDPSEDLPMARAEADAVESRLRAAGWTVAARSGSAVTRSGLVEALAGASLLHYAGHGVHRGETGWDAALLLPDGDSLAVTDILALPAMPRTVVLTGCDTGHVSAATLGGGMSLGRAFVFAGASAVVAADEKVDDALARHLGEALYDDPAALDVAAALRRAQLRLRDDGERGWEAFRVITR